MSDQGVPVRLGGAGNPQTQQPGSVLDVRVVGFDMSFLNLVVFFIKAALAAIPAAIIVFIIYALIGAVFLGGMMSRFGH